MLHKYLSILILLVMVIGGFGIGLAQIPSAAGALDYQFIVNEQGLPAGYAMWVIINPIPFSAGYASAAYSLLSPDTSISITLPTGFYNATFYAYFTGLGPSYPYFPSIPYTTFKLFGNFTFSEIFTHGYWVIFNSSNIAKNSSWSVNTSLNIGTDTTNGPNLIYLPVKIGSSFSYNISASGYISYPSTGHLTVTDQNITVPVKFVKNTSSVGFLYSVQQNWKTVIKWVQPNWETLVIITIVSSLVGWLGFVILPSRSDRKKNPKKHRKSGPHSTGRSKRSRKR